jgi:tetratricopeptide (TPR) repeat protein
MRRISTCYFLAGVLLATVAHRAPAQKAPDQVASAVATGDDLLKRKEFEAARDAYRKGDKLSHHTCAQCLLGMSGADRQLGDFAAALDEAKRAAQVAGDDRPMAAQAHLVRGVLLAQMASKPSDKKLREAESEFREAIESDPTQAVAHFDLGETLIRQERDEDGVLEMKKYIAAPGAIPSTIHEAQLIIANPIRAREPFAPSFSFATLEGATVSNATLRGKVVLLDFWFVVPAVPRVYSDTRGPQQAIRQPTVSTGGR